MRDFRKINAWKRSHFFVLKTYKATDTYPAKEQFGLTSQLRRAVLSIPTNISEGCGRSTDADFSRFIDISQGSASEADYLLLVSRDLGYINTDIYDEMYKELTEIRKMLAGLVKAIRKSKS